MSGFVQQQIQQMSDLKAAATLVATGAGGSILDAMTELTRWTDLVVKFGNVALILGGVYLMWVKIQNSRHRHRRKDDKIED